MDCWEQLGGVELSVCPNHLESTASGSLDMLFLNEYEVRRLSRIVTSFSWCVSHGVSGVLVGQVC